MSEVAMSEQDEHAESSPQETVERDFESEASAIGWVPAEDFRGDPAKHKTAQEFVELGETRVPLLLNNLKRLQETVQKQGAAIEYQAQHHRTALKEQNARLRSEYEAKMQEAVREGDEDAYLKAKKGRDDVVDPVAPATSQTQPPEVSEFINSTPWYRSDRAMTIYADAESARLAKEFPNLTIEQNLTRVKASVESEFAHKLSNPRRGDAPTVSGARKPGKQTRQTFANLPQEAKDACESFRKDGVFGKGCSKEDAQKQYLSTYDWSE